MEHYSLSWELSPSHTLPACTLLSEVSELCYSQAGLNALQRVDMEHFNTTYPAWTIPLSREMFPEHQSCLAKPFRNQPDPYLHNSLKLFKYTGTLPAGEVVPSLWKDRGRVSELLDAKNELFSPTLWLWGWNLWNRNIVRPFDQCFTLFFHCFTNLIFFTDQTS